MLAITWTEKALHVPVKYLVENWFVEVPRNNSQWLCPQLKLNMLLLLGVMQVLGGNYSSTEQVNSIQQLLIYSLITGTEDPSKVTEIELTAHIIVVNNQMDLVSPPPLVAKPKKGKSQTVTSTSPKSQGPEASGALSKKRKRPTSKKPPIETKMFELFFFLRMRLEKDPSKVTEIELTAHIIVVNNQMDLVSPPPLVAKPKKGKSQTVTSTSPKSRGPEALGALSKKRKRPTSKKPPIETKVTPPKTTKGSEQSHSDSSGTVPDPQDLERYIQFAST
nr:nodulin MtN21 /EamA-like transporter family protein [Tanacetum cinerariifolium]